MSEAKQTDGSQGLAGWFAVGVFCAPYIFAWWTLRPEYSTMARRIAFGWMILFGFSAVVNGIDARTQKARADAEASKAAAAAFADQEATRQGLAARLPADEASVRAQVEEFDAWSKKGCAAVLSHPEPKSANVVAEYAAAGVAFDDQLAVKVKDRTQHRAACLNLDLARDQAKAKNWAFLPDTLVAVTAAVDGVSKEYLRREAVDALRAEADKLAEKYTPDVVAYRVTKELCGPEPTISAWDGSIIGLERAFGEVAHDPDSVEISECTKPRMSDNCWLTTCKVRAKNGFGALVLQRYRFAVTGGIPLRLLDADVID